MNGSILSGDRQLGQAELLTRVAKAAAGLQRLGIGEEDAVAIMLRNDFPFFEASMAANVLGAHAVPVNWHFQQEEAGYIFRDCDAKAVVVHADLLPQIEGAVPEEEYTIPFGKANVMRSGADCTIVSFGRPVYFCLEAADELASLLRTDYLEAEAERRLGLLPPAAGQVVDLRTKQLADATRRAER